jgi:hypothetical protein
MVRRLSGVVNRGAFGSLLRGDVGAVIRLMGRMPFVAGHGRVQSAPPLMVLQ